MEEKFERLTKRKVFLLVGVIEGCLVLLSLLLSNFVHIDLWKVLRVGPGFLLHLLLGLTLGFFISFGFYLTVTRISYLKELFGSILLLIFGNLGIAEIFAISFIASFAEELFFRGVLQSIIGIFLTSIIFGLFHSGLSYRLLPYGIYAFVASLILGILYAKTGDFYSVFACHFCINFTSGILWKRKIICSGFNK